MSSPTADVILELEFARMAPTDLRAAIKQDGTTLIDKHAPPGVRTGWLGRPFNGDPTPDAALNHVNGCLTEASPELTAALLVDDDSYCWVDIHIICYFVFGVLYEGAPLICESTASGLTVACPLRARLIYKPG